MDIMPGQSCIGFVGLGVMGQSMAGHILAAGYDLFIYTRTRSSATALIDEGAVWEDRLEDLAAKCDVIITMVGFPDDVEQIYMGDGGILSHARKGTLVIDMTTSRPDLAVKIHDAAMQRQIDALDAPVSGGDLGAKNATLSIMVGGDEKKFQKALPLLKLMGKNIVLQGKEGSGQSCKMANQMVIATAMIGVCEAISYSKKAGLDPETVLESIGQGAAGSWSLNNLGPRMIKGDFDPGFYIKHFIKDMKIARDSSGQLGQKAPGLSLALSLYEKLAQDGDEDLGTQALIKLFE